MNNRLENIKKIEVDIFGRQHVGTFDAAFNYMNNYLSEHYFGEQGYEWNHNKVLEELDEITDAYEQLSNEILNTCPTPESLHHVVEEIGDWVLATSSILGHDMFSQDEYKRHLCQVQCIIEDINNRLYVVFGEDVITVDAVFNSNKSKLEEYTAAYKTYLEVQGDEMISNNPLAKIIRLLHTNKELRDPESKDKIIKEIRRMRFAIIEYKKWGV